MKVVERKAERLSYEPSEWQRRVTEAVLADTAGNKINYQGKVLASTEPSYDHAIEFEFKSSVIRVMETNIPLWVSDDALIRFSVNDQPVDDIELTAEKDQTPIAHRLTKDVTRWGEGHDTSRIRLRISYHGKLGKIMLPMDDDEPDWRPRLIQKWVWPNALQSILFFVMSWGIILGLAILIVLYLRSQGESFPLYSVLIVVATWAAAVLGLPDLTRIPLRRLLRRSYSATRNQRALVLAALFIILLSVSVGVGIISYCIKIRHEYSALIEAALDDPHDVQTITRAFVLQPWRKEAQILFERYAFEKRYDMKAFRESIRGFVSNEGARHAVDVAASSPDPPFLLDKSSSAINDPVIWFASVLPEGDEDENIFTRQAIALLSSRTNGARPDYEAQLLRTSLQLGQSPDDEAIPRQLLELLSRAGAYPKVTPTQTYQFACDVLATYFVTECQQEEASKWYRKELDARNASARLNESSTSPLWVRPPNKLMLYYMFRSYEVKEGPDRKYLIRAVQLLNLVPECEPQFSPTFQEVFLSAPYKSYNNPEVWLAGTVLDPNRKPASYIKDTLLHTGWRY